MDYFISYPIDRMRELLGSVRKLKIAYGRTFSNIKLPAIDDDNGNYGILAARSSHINEVVSCIQYKDGNAEMRFDPYEEMIVMMSADHEAMFYREPMGVLVSSFLEKAGYKTKKTIANSDGMTIDMFLLGKNWR